MKNKHTQNKDNIFKFSVPFNANKDFPYIDDAKIYFDNIEKIITWYKKNSSSVVGNSNIRY